MAKQLNLIKTNNEQISKEWGFQVYFRGELFARCNAEGIVNWEKTVIYNSTQLVGRDSVTILKQATKSDFNICKQI